MKSRISIFVYVALFVSFGAVPAFSQSGTASLRGAVRDPGGLAVAGANVQAINVDTNASYPTTTNDDGLYNLPTLPPGNYRITVQKEGFNGVDRTGIELHVADAVTLDFALQVGAVSQTVSVCGEAPLVNTENSQLGGLVQASEVASLPLNGRNYINLTLLQPGIAPNITGTGGSINGTWFSSNGATVHSNNFLLDGAIMQEINGGSTANFSGRTLGLDGIQEYRVVTTSFSAEYGLLAGSQTIMVSKGGTNQFHGSAFEYLRNSVLDAANFFDKGVEANNFQRLPPYKRNNFGGSFGGPIRKDKTFFFATYEQLQERLGITVNNTVLALGCHGALGAVITNTACPQLGSTSSVTIGSVSPAVAALIALYPNPDIPGTTTGYTTPYSQPESDRFGQIRVDQVFSTNDTAFVRYTIDDDAQILGLQYPELFINPRFTRHQYATLGENHTISSSLLNSFRFSFSRTASSRTSPDQFIGPNYSFVAGQPMGPITVTGTTGTLGPIANPPAIQRQNILTWSDDLIYTVGRHSFKFGALINSFRDYGVQNMKVEGSLSFNSVASFLTGSSNVGSGFQAVLPPTITDRTIQFYTTGFYVQDEWRVRNNLTVNLGLRYEPSPNYMHEVHGISSSIRNLATDTTATVGPNFLNPTLHNFSPRLGFAWDVFGDGKTSVRGGASLVYNISDIWNGAIFNIQNAQVPYSFQFNGGGMFTLPFNFGGANPVVSSASTDQYNLKQERLYRWNLTIERQLPFGMALSVSYTGSRGEHLPSIWEGDPNTPAGFFPSGVPFWPTSGTVTKLNPSPTWKTISVFGSNGDSIYHGAQVSLIKRMSKGLQFQSSFTWSKILDNTEGNSTSDQATGVTTYPSDIFNPRFDRGPASFNIPLNWTFNAIYNLPSPKIQERFLAGLTGGWGVTGIYTLRSGFPFNPTEGTDRSNSNNGANNADRPNLAAGRSVYSVTHGVTSAPCAVTGGNWPNNVIPAGTALGTPTLFFDPCAFTEQTAGTLGNVLRDGFVGPGLNQLDFAVKKDTKLGFLGEAGNLTFRAEFFNIFNHPNFNPPSLSTFSGGLTDAGVPVGTAGQIVTTGSNTSRQVELSLRVVF